MKYIIIKRELVYTEVKNIGGKTSVTSWLHETGRLSSSSTRNPGEEIIEAVSTTGEDGTLVHDMHPGYQRPLSSSEQRRLTRFYKWKLNERRHGRSGHG